MVWPSMKTSSNHQWRLAPVINEDQFQSSMKTSSSHQWRPTFVISRRLRTYTLHRVKGGEGLSKPFTSRNPSVYRGFKQKGEGWRVKSRVGFLPAKRLWQQTIFQITDGSSEEFFLPTYRFVPGNGTKLPCQRAISCRNQAINERRLLSKAYNPRSSIKVWFASNRSESKRLFI